MMVAMDATPETVTEALALLAADGYGVDFNLIGRSMTCPVCRCRPSTSRAAAIERFDEYRFEGDSDPGDEAIVLGLRCADCGARGVFVSAARSRMLDQVASWSHLSGPPESARRPIDLARPIRRRRVG